MITRTEVVWWVMAEQRDCIGQALTATFAWLDYSEPEREPPLSRVCGGPIDATMSQHARGYMSVSDGHGALFSRGRLHRYRLWRTLGRGTRRVAFIGLNPSVADEERNDPTVSRCIEFARQWGFSRFEMLNAFAFVATDPKEMLAAGDPVGPENDKWLQRIVSLADLVVAAWGAHGTHLGRDEQLRELLSGVQLHHLGLTKHGHPRHPLRLPAGVRPVEWR